MLCACAKPTEEPSTTRTAAAPVKSVPAAAEAVAPAEIKPNAQAVLGTPITTAPAVAAPGVEAPAASALAAARTCAVRQRLALDSRATLGSLVADGERALVLLFVPSGSGGTLELSHSEGATREPMVSVTLATPLALAPVAQLDSEGFVSMALVDTQGTLSWLEVRKGKASAPRVLARGIDRRFLPSMTRTRGMHLVAFTQTVDELMHTFVARVSPSSVELSDVTPISHGAAAATFVLGATEPTLVMLDARAGVSPLLEVGFAANGRARPAIVRTPVSQPYAPPLLAAFEVAGADTQVAYTAIGRGAATAVGIVPLRRAEAARALLPSLGYGPLSFTVALGSRALVFATESPVSAASDAVRSIMVKVIDDRGEGEALLIACQGSTCARPMLAASAKKRAFFLMHAEGTALVLSVLDCDA